MSRSDRGSSAGGHSWGGGFDWEEYRDEATGDLCYYNAISGEARWADEGAGSTSVGQGDEAWARITDDATGRMYMHHAETGQSVWLEDLTDDAAALRDVQREHEVVPLGERGWGRHIDKATECQFFYHASSGFSSWVDDRGSSGSDDE